MANDTVNEVIKPQLHPVVETMIQLAPVLAEVFPDDVTIGVSDLTTLWLSVPGKTFSLGLQPGYRLTPGDGMYEVVDQGRPTRTFVPESVFGVPMMANSIPLCDEQGNIVGAMGVGISMQRYNHLFEVASALSSAVEQISATVEEVAGSINVLADNMSDISHQSDEVLKSMRDIRKISDRVKDISNNSRILGLNASIEASRSNQIGKGFAVIAREVRKLADDAKRQTEIISGTVDEVERLLNRLAESIVAVNRETESQSAATQELASTIQEVSQSAVALAKYAESIVSGDGSQNE
ncbi:methyl-accepting chemotaxis protein (MCP) signaling protein [Alicyclobacillus sacchari]|uniref:Methyl-accepting chemotaxis protein (MCP) signaling protein n=1 Tax=Alicyclobacillus sacchari TaxID=392010 RepID=A0A4R8LUH6_9BACL|nr:methyl-accepting chemotaxis protein [Alicyclobacillus sacchari]TDY51430.1 methyl-accepting chemotaxis protein (MCP) signaling protein [Alicyclobacillus sacchari]GMA56775.1 putative sensory transducer protein YfmS [Alicyclobacillus sacchari]